MFMLARWTWVCNGPFNWWNSVWKWSILKWNQIMHLCSLLCQKRNRFCLWVKYQLLCFDDLYNGEVILVVQIHKRSRKQAFIWLSAPAPAVPCFGVFVNMAADTELWRPSSIATKFITLLSEAPHAPNREITLRPSCQMHRGSCKCFFFTPYQRGRRGEFSDKGRFRHLQQDPPLLQREERLGPAPDDGGLRHGRDVRPTARRLPCQLPGLKGRYLQVR